MEGGIFRKKTVFSNEINENIVYLIENITNLHTILIHLIQHGIISNDERQLINSETTDSRRNDLLLSLIQKKNWSERKPVFIQILRCTGNEHCANLIEEHAVNSLNRCSDSKWWPEKKTLPKAFLERKSEQCLLIDTLKNILSRSASDGMAVITQQVTVSGLGGIGKTTTAIWFAQQYEKEYDHLIWIDCGEKSLLNSFRNLAVDLDLKNRSEKSHDVKLLAAGSFQILKDFKCLLIFDNAECYIGNEGIKDVLPKDIKNFDVLITSRNKQWGDANGDGEIPQLPMNVFNQNESVEFMKKHIKVLPENADSQLQLLCDLLGNLPLAIQIAIATLNRQKPIKLENYIHKILNTPEILHAEFDKYEKTIDKTMKISLGVIQQHESNDKRKIGEISLRILSIFGFITPDNVEAKFFIAVETKQLTSWEKIMSTLFNVNYQTKLFSEDEIDEAMNVLEVYSLITRNVISEDKYTVSIHRLLQQVIRHNFKKAEQQILTQILKCDGYLEYKLIPFSYADEKLQKKFPQIKAELIDKLKLSQLLIERRFNEAVELSRIIKNTLKNQISEFNFAVCLKHNSELTESKSVFESILDKINIHESTHETIITGYSTKTEIIESGHQLNQNIVINHLFSIFLNENNFERARNLVVEWKQVTLPMLPLNDLINFLNLMSLPNIFLQLHEDESCITLKVETLNKLKMKLELHYWVLDENTRFHQDLQDLVLIKCSIVDRKHPYLAVKNVKLRHINIASKLRHDNNLGGTLLFTDDFVDFDKHEKTMFNFIKIQLGSDKATKGNVLRAKIRQIFEWEMEMWTWTWMINTLLVCHRDLTQKNPMTLTDITLEHCSIYISILPPALKKLALFACTLINCLKSKSLPNRLEELSLIHIFVKDVVHGEQCTPFDISHFITPMLNKLTVINFAGHCVRLCVSLNCLTSIESLHLAECALVLDRDIICIAPTELTLKYVRIIDTHQMILSHVIVNEFVNFNQTTYLCLTGMSIDFSEPVRMKELILRNANTINWKRGRWTVNKFSMFPSLGPTEMKIDQLVNMLDEDDAKNSSMQTRKEELLKYFKSISGYKTISGLYHIRDVVTANKEFNMFQNQFKKSTGVWTIAVPERSADAFKWQSFIDQIIFNWINGHLVHIRWEFVEHPLNSISILKKDDMWIIWKKELDTLAYCLQQLETAGVVVICELLPWINTTFAFWRIYERNDKIKLYQMTRDYLTQHHGLSSLIWVWSINVELFYGMTGWKKYWPGDNYVDVISVFSSKPLTSAHYHTVLEMVGDKPISMEASGYVPTPQLLVTQSRWTWFTLQYNLRHSISYNKIETILNSPSVINKGSHEMFNTLN